MILYLVSSMGLMLCNFSMYFFKAHNQLALAWGLQVLFCAGMSVGIASRKRPHSVSLPLLTVSWSVMVLALSMLWGKTSVIYNLPTILFGGFVLWMGLLLRHRESQRSQSYGA